MNVPAIVIAADAGQSGASHAKLDRPPAANAVARPNVRRCCAMESFCVIVPPPPAGHVPKDRNLMERARIPARPAVRA